MSAKILLQALNILNKGSYNENEFKMYFDYLKTFKEEKIINYFNSCSDSNYNNDLEIYFKLIDNLIEKYEYDEEYEKCEVLKNRKIESLNIINSNKNNFNMSPLKIDEDEKKKILEQHQKLEAERKLEKERLKQGLQKPEKKESPK